MFIRLVLNGQRTDRSRVEGSYLQVIHLSRSRDDSVAHGGSADEDGFQPSAARATRGGRPRGDRWLRQSPSARSVDGRGTTRSLLARQRSPRAAAAAGIPPTHPVGSANACARLAAPTLASSRF